jgi:hypothetical protein
LEANFGDDLANKPFQYDIESCPGMVFENDGFEKAFLESREDIRVELQ